MLTPEQEKRYRLFYHEARKALGQYGIGDDNLAAADIKGIRNNDHFTVGDWKPILNAMHHAAEEARKAALEEAAKHLEKRAEQVKDDLAGIEIASEAQAIRQLAEGGGRYEGQIGYEPRSHTLSRLEETE